MNNRHKFFGNTQIRLYWNAKRLTLGAFTIAVLGILAFALMMRASATSESDLKLSEFPEMLTKITAADGGSSDGFGQSIAMSGDTAVIGADGSQNGAGSVYVYVRDGANWVQQQKITAADPAANAGFGGSVAISGDTVIVGSRGSNGNRGAAYFFKRTGTVWTQQEKVQASDGATGDFFGSTVSISGETAIIGAPSDDVLGNTDRGSAYVFGWNGTLWVQQQQLIAGDGAAFKFFGQSVAISGDRLAVGHDDGPQFLHRGSVHTYTRNGTVWTFRQKLLAPDATNNDNLGVAVAMSGGTLVAGAPGFSPTVSGAVYLWTVSEDTWTLEIKLTPMDGQPGDKFGRALAISGERLMVGAPGDGNGDVGDDEGSAYSFKRCSAPWSFEEKFVATDGAEDDFLGNGVGLSGGTSILGAPGDDNGAVEDQGSAYVAVLGTSQNRGSVCESEIEVNITTDQPDADLEDNECDVDEATMGQQCSLRAAIQTANDLAGPDTITFNIPGGGVQTISPAANLPAISSKVTIDATTQPGYTNRPVIQIVGTIATNTGLEFASGSGTSSLSGVSIYGFSEQGILLTSDGNSIKRSHIGTDATGSTAGQIQRVGVKVRGSGNFIGETASGNLITRNSEIHVLIEGAGATANFVRKNIIGFDLNEDRSDPAANIGVQIVDGASANIIGGSVEADENEITADDAAVEISRGSNDNTVIRNQLVFSEAGVLVLNSSRNRIGGANISETNREGNIIDQADFGIVFSEEVPTVNSASRKWALWREKKQFFAHERGMTNADNKAFGNLIAADEAPKKNSVGIVVEASNDTLIGNGQTEFANNIFDQTDCGILVLNDSQRTKINVNRLGLISAENGGPNKIGIRLTGNGSEVTSNLVSGNIEVGIAINRIDDADPVPTGNLVHSNRIGIDFNNIAIPNETGILLDGRENTITNNVVSGNSNLGLDVRDDRNTIANNRIGTNADGNTDIGNENGVLISSSHNTLTSNTISGNRFGIAITRDPNIPSSNANDNILRGNTIGTSRDGTTALGNDVYGVFIANGAQRNFIGGIAAGQGNVISGNGQMGIAVAPGTVIGATPPTLNKIQGNFIGTNITATASIPNGEDGIFISAATNNLIGGFGSEMPGARNIISGNSRNGILLVGSAMQNRISGNYIGTKADGASALGNTERGIRVGTSVSGTIIGGTEANAGNTIGFNGSNGISLTNDAGNNNLIDPNRIFGNALAGIDIGENGFTPNDPTDADVGPNKLQNYPTFTLAVVGGDLIVSYQVDSAPQHSTYGGTGIYVEFFEADATGAGRDFLGSDHFLLSDYSNGTPGTRQKNLGNAAALGVVAGDRLTATATDADGNSSEFTPAVVLAGPPVTIGGRVTTPSGLGLRNAIVTLVEPSGVRRTATTSSFGIYSFANVPSGLNYTISVASKRYRFAPRIQVINQSLNDLDFVGLE